MRKNKTSFLVLSSLVAIATLAALPSCKKSNSSSPGGMSASLNSTAFQATFTTGVDFKVFNQLTMAGLMIKGSDSNYLEIQFPDTAKINHPMTISNYDAIWIDYYPKGKVNGYFYEASDLDGSCTITLTSLDTVGHKVSGTFSGVLKNFSGGTDSVVINNGQFNASYIAH